VEQPEENKYRKRQVDMETSSADSGKVIYDVRQSENKKTKLFEPLYCQNSLQKQEESKQSPEWKKHSISGYYSQGRSQGLFHKDIRPSHTAPFPPSSISNTSASDFIPKRAPHLGYSHPTSTLTSQAYEREQEQERKPKIENLPPNVSHIKKEPSLLDDFVYDGSMKRNGTYVNPHTSIKSSFPNICPIPKYSSRQ
jgi:hypothetical protein